jgi:hypothetical protein
MDLTLPPGSFDPTTHRAGYVPGWTERSYPGYSGYAWYRSRVSIQDAAQVATGQLAIKMPTSLDDAYQEGLMRGHLLLALVWLCRSRKLP